MKVQSTYRLDENASTQLAELFRTSAVLILPPPIYLTFIYNFIGLDNVLPCAK